LEFHVSREWVFEHDFFRTSFVLVRLPANSLIVIC
jgi:T6SS, Phospholipase effector Tle1-like, catalytic domain